MEFLEKMRAMMEEVLEENNRKWREELSRPSEDDVKVTENEEVEQNNLPMCNDQVETQALPGNKNTELVDSKIKKTEERETKIKGIIRPKKTRITKEILEMTRSGLINFVDNPIIRYRARIKGKKYEQDSLKILKVNHSP